MAMRKLKKEGLLKELEESEKINACNLTTSKTVSFQGIDTTGNSQLELVRSDLALGYDPDDGEVYGFTPANSR